MAALRRPLAEKRCQGAGLISIQSALRDCTVSEAGRDPNSASQAIRPYDDANRVVQSRSTDSGTSMLGEYNYALDCVGNRTSMWDSNGDSSNWNYDGINQQRIDYYIPTASGLSWSTFTLKQWDDFTLAQWDSLPLNSSAIQSGSSVLAYDAAGNRLTRQDEVTSEVTTFTSGTTMRTSC